MDNQKPAFVLLSWKNLAFLTGVLALFWLPVEDQTIIIPTLLVIPIAWLVARLGYQRFRMDLILSGITGGLVVAPLTLILMAFKTGLHGHGLADFSAGQILRVIQAAPVWIIVGGMLGWIWRRIRSHTPSN